jgi:hypothetical protein
VRFGASPSPGSSVTGGTVGQAAPIADGTYTTGPLPIASVEAAWERRGLDAHAADFFGDAQTVEFSIRLDGGDVTYLFAVGDAAPEIATHGHYTFPDDHTLRYVDQDGSVNILTLEVQGDGFSASLDDATLTRTGDPIALLFNVGQWESGPYRPVE